MSETFITRFTKLLEDCRPERSHILKFFITESSTVIENAMSEMVHVVVNYLTEYNAQFKKELFECCKTVLIIIAERYNPMETVLVFLEHIECLDNDVKLHAMLKPLKICIRKTEDKSKAIEWCVSTIKSYVEDLPVPNNDADGEAASYRIMDVYKEIVSFLFSMAREMNVDSEIKRESLTWDYFLSLLISMYGKPFCYLNENIVESVTYKSISDELMLSIFYMVFYGGYGDGLYFLNIVSNRCRNIVYDKAPDGCTYSEDYIRSMLFELKDNVSNLAYANFYFHIITDEGYWKNVPQIYSPHYILETCTYLSQILLCEEQEILVSNGLIFMENVIKRVSPRSVGFEVLGLRIYSDLFKSIIKIMIYCDNDAERKKAVHVFRKYIEIFDTETRYSVLLYLYETCEHSGMMSFITGILKSFIIECLDSTPRDPHFLGKNMEMMLKKVCNLPHGSSSDLVEISDEVITALNLLRFLFIRDKHNETGIWDIKDTIESDYLKPLREGIDLCRAHWRMKIKDLEQQKEHYVKIHDYDEMKKADAEVTLTVGGEQLPIMPFSKKVAFCYQAINGLDIMESILIRVNECINNVNYVEEKSEYAT